MKMTESKFTVAVLGAAGGIGQPLSLLLKQCPLVKKLVLFDVVDAVVGVGADLSHIETPAEVEAIVGAIKDQEKQKKELRRALQGVDVCVIPAGIPRKPGMTRDDLFKINAGIVRGLIEGICEICPKAMTLIISNPVNANVPIAAEIMKKAGVFDQKRLFGVSTLDVVRSNTFVAEALGVDVRKINVSVVGGHSGVTILPILSEFSSKLDKATIEKLTKRIQNAGTEVVEAKKGAGSATLSMAHAGARFAISVMKAMNGEKGITECAYVAYPNQGVEYFAAPVLLGTEGIQKVIVPEMSDFEKNLLKDEVLPNLQKSITKGVGFMN